MKPITAEWVAKAEGDFATLECFAGWIDRRHAQIETSELVYIAHQMDFLGRAHSR